MAEPEGGNDDAKSLVAASEPDASPTPFYLWPPKKLECTMETLPRVWKAWKEDITVIVVLLGFNIRTRKKVVCPFLTDPKIVNSAFFRSFLICYLKISY
jgi:hypothetical protein